MKISTLNPDDTTLDEIHSIQEASYEKQKHWSFQELQFHYQGVIDKISRETGTSFNIIKHRTFGRLGQKMFLKC